MTVDKERRGLRILATPFVLLHKRIRKSQKCVTLLRRRNANLAAIRAITFLVLPRRLYRFISATATFLLPRVVIAA
jgi:hypothetical protein